MILSMEPCHSSKINMCCSNVSYPESVTSYNQLASKPLLNGEILQGDKNSKDYGLYGADNPETFMHTQPTPSNRWEITHNLHKYPSITVVDSAGTVVMGEYEFVDENTVICTFSGAFSGECYLN